MDSMNIVSCSIFLVAACFLIHDTQFGQIEEVILAPYLYYLFPVYSLYDIKPKNNNKIINNVFLRIYPHGRNIIICVYQEIYCKNLI